ncbi:MAG: NYN domain-containing protein [Chloroflexi bacterium]|nr:NYN domain-containing protein [Chloroflexota bacterium]
MPAIADAQLFEERVMIFIDGSNLYHVLTQNCGRHDLVFEKFSEKLGGGRQVKRTYYYNIRQDPTYNPAATAEQDKFMATLFDTPYFEVKLGVHRRQGDTMVEKGVDVMMATDIVVGAFRDLYDTAIVVSGDGDFFPAMQAAKDLGKHIEVVAFESNLSPEAKRVADKAILLRKTHFTGLWTRGRRTSTSQSDSDDSEDEKKPTRSTTSTRRRRTSSSSSSSSKSTSSAATEKVAERPETKSEDSAEVKPERAPRRRRAISRRSSSSTNGSNGADGSNGSNDMSGAGDSSSSERAPDPEPTRERAPDPAPEPAPAPAQPSSSSSDSSGSSGNDEREAGGSVGGSWWRRNRSSRDSSDGE